MEHILEVKNLNVSFKSYLGTVRAVQGVDFVLDQKETLAMVGESGCGKTVTAKSILRLFGRTTGTIADGSQILFEGKDILKMDKNELSDLRGAGISMIFQDSMTSLNPTMRVGKQIAECIRLHNRVSRQEAMQRACELLRLGGIPNPEERLKNYPHQMSGGMRQRVHDRHGAFLQPQDSDRRRADHRPGRHHPGADSGAAEGLAGKARHGRSSWSPTTWVSWRTWPTDIQRHVRGPGGGAGQQRRTSSTARTHPYTWALLDSIPSRSLPRKSRLYSLKGTPPNLSLPIEGCPFAARCRYCMPVCRKCAPQPTDFSSTHQASCWLNHPMAPQHVREGGSR